MGEGGEVLFVEHRNGWEIPGGHLETNETPESKLLRELKGRNGTDRRVRPLEHIVLSGGLGRSRRGFERTRAFMEGRG